jgi:hypothetical protein
MKSRGSIVFAGATICTLAIYFLASSYLSPNPVAETTNSSGTIGNATAIGANQTSGDNYGKLLSGSAIYPRLGYPMLTYGGLPPYSPGEANFTLVYQSNHFYFTVGTVETPVMNLTQAVNLAQNREGLSNVNYSLVEAEFDPGTIVNGTIKSSAVWNLGFVRVYHGYWLYGLADNYGSTNFVSIDATSGAILQALGSQSTEPIAGNFKLGINASQALAVVRGLGSFQNIPLVLTKSGNVTSISPRIIKFGSASNVGNSVNNFNYVDASVAGQYRLCWRISLFYPPRPQGSQGIFYVDAQSGKLLGASGGIAYPESPGVGVNASFVFASAKNLTVAQETFQSSVNATGLPSSVPVAVPDVVIARPGSTASIQVNFSSNLQNHFIGNITFSNPLPDIQNLQTNGLPVGVTASFSNDTLVLNGAVSSTRTVFFTIDRNAPAGTYLVSLGAAFAGYGVIGSQLSFFLTIWNGTGQWPPPPSAG